MSKSQGVASANSSSAAKETTSDRIVTSKLANSYNKTTGRTTRSEKCMKDCWEERMRRKSKLESRKNMKIVLLLFLYTVV